MSRVYGFRDFLSAMITQLCPPQGSFKSLQALYRSCVEKYPEIHPTTLQLQRVSIEILQALSTPAEALQTHTDSRRRNSTLLEPGEVFLIIDGLDKISPATRDKFLVFFRTIEALEISNLHVLVISQMQSGIRDSFGTSQKWTPYNIQPANTRADIQLYIARVIQENVQMSKQGSRLKKKIEEHVLAKCENRM